MTNHPMPPATAGVEHVHVVPTIEAPAERSLTDILQGMVEQMRERRNTRQRMQWIAPIKVEEERADYHVTLIVSLDADPQDGTYHPDQDSDHGIRQGL